LRTLSILLILLAGCQAKDRQPVEDTKTSSTDTGTLTGGTTTGDTGTTGTVTGTSSATISASCQGTANELRKLCSVSVDPPQSVDFRFSKTDGTGPERLQRSEGIEGSHLVTLFLMEAESEYDWTVSARNDPSAEAGGSFETGSLPTGADVDFTINGESTLDYMMLQSPCITDAYVVITDPNVGEVLWYEDFSTGAFDPVIDGASWTEDNTVIAVVADDVIEKDLFGNQLLKLERLIDYDNRVHHDVFRKNGRTFFLFSETVNWQNADYDLDGFYIFENGVKIAEWHLFDHFQPTEIPIGWPGRDYSHANSVWQDDNGDVLVSFRHLSAVASVIGEPTDPDFGTINWRIAGDPFNQEFGSDFLLTGTGTSEISFERQHNAHLLPNGDLALFDNREGLTELSRLITIDLDTTNWLADINNEYVLPTHCDFQGGAWHTPAGNPVATCAPLRTAYEFDVGDTFPRWDGQASCANGMNTYIPRFIPWEAPF